jgi:hypothetical protein
LLSKEELRSTENIIKELLSKPLFDVTKKDDQHEQLKFLIAYLKGETPLEKDNKWFAEVRSYLNHKNKMIRQIVIITCVLAVLESPNNKGLSGSKDIARSLHNRLFEDEIKLPLIFDSLSDHRLNDECFISVLFLLKNLDLKEVHFYDPQWDTLSDQRFYGLCACLCDSKLQGIFLADALGGVGNNRFIEFMKIFKHHQFSHLEIRENILSFSRRRLALLSESLLNQNHLKFLSISFNDTENTTEENIEIFCDFLKKAKIYKLDFSKNKLAFSSIEFFSKILHTIMNSNIIELDLYDNGFDGTSFHYHSRLILMYETIRTVLKNNSKLSITGLPKLKENLTIKGSHSSNIFGFSINIPFIFETNDFNAIVSRNILIRKLLNEANLIIRTPLINMDKSSLYNTIEKIKYLESQTTYNSNQGIDVKNELERSFNELLQKLIELELKKVIDTSPAKEGPYAHLAEESSAEVLLSLYLSTKPSSQYYLSSRARSFELVYNSHLSDNIGEQLSFISALDKCLGEDGTLLKFDNDDQKIFDGYLLAACKIKGGFNELPLKEDMRLALIQLALLRQAKVNIAALDGTNNLNFFSPIANIPNRISDVDIKLINILWDKYANQLKPIGIENWDRLILSINQISDPLNGSGTDQSSQPNSKY